MRFDASFRLIVRLAVGVADDQTESVDVLKGIDPIETDQTLLGAVEEEEVGEEAAVEKERKL